MVQDKMSVLNRAGLSKDNFSEANSAAVVQRSSQQSCLDDYFLSQEEEDIVAATECKELENDQMLLEKLLDESFN